jgi:hypothetical protein
MFKNSVLASDANCRLLQMPAEEKIPEMGIAPAYPFPAWYQTRSNVDPLFWPAL